MRKLMAASLVLTVCVALAASAQSIRSGVHDDEQDDFDFEAPSAARGTLDFDYQFGIVDEGGDARYVSQVPTLASGERFTVRVRARQTAYAYLFVTDGSGHYTLMPPESNGPGMATRVERQRWTTIPDEHAVMRLDDRRGVERVYLVVAPRRVAEIERLAQGGDELSVSEDWLVELRSRVAARSRWTKEQIGTLVRARYTGGSAVALEDIAFRHE
jgi:hypothetical protein